MIKEEVFLACWNKNHLSQASKDALKGPLSQVETLKLVFQHLVEEIYPFTVHNSQLRFERNYFSIKRGKITDEVLKQDKNCKSKMICDFYKAREHSLFPQIAQYRETLLMFISSNPEAMDFKRIEYTLRQNDQHLERMKAFKKRIIDSDPVCQAALNSAQSAPCLSVLPYDNRWFSFSEDINKEMERPEIHLEISKNQLLNMLDCYNKRLKESLGNK